MELFRLFGSVLIDDKEAIKSLKDMDKKTQATYKSFNTVANGAKKFGVALVAGTAAAAAGIYKMATSTAEAADEIDKMSQQVGLSRKGYQEWSYVLSQSGVEIESVSTGMKTLTQRIDQATEGAGLGAEVFEELGISIEDSMSQEDVFNEVVYAMQEMEDGTEKAALAIDIFGKSGQDLMPLLNGSAESVEELKTKAEELGMILGDETIDAGVEFTDTIDTLKTSFATAGAEIGGIFLPYVQDFADWIEENMPNITDKIELFAEKVEDGIDFLVENKDLVVTALGAIAIAIIGLTVVQTMLNIAMYANPAVLLITAFTILAGSIALCTFILINFWDEFELGLSIVYPKFYTFIKDLEAFNIQGAQNVNYAWQQAFWDMKDAAADMVNGISGFIVSGVNIWLQNFTDGINALITLYNSLPFNDPISLIAEAPQFEATKILGHVGQTASSAGMPSGLPEMGSVSNYTSPYVQGAPSYITQDLINPTLASSLYTPLATSSTDMDAMVTQLSEAFSSGYGFCLCGR